jgi:hypothetical protein
MKQKASGTSEQQEDETTKQRETRRQDSGAMGQRDGGEVRRGRTVIRENADDKNGEGQCKTTTAGGGTVSGGHAVSVSFLFSFLFHLLATNYETFQVLIRR